MYGIPQIVSWSDKKNYSSWNFFFLVKNLNAWARYPWNLCLRVLCIVVLVLYIWQKTHRCLKKHFHAGHSNYSKTMTFVIKIIVVFDKSTLPDAVWAERCHYFNPLSFILIHLSRQTPVFGPDATVFVLAVMGKEVSILPAFNKCPYFLL